MSVQADRVDPVAVDARPRDRGVGIWLLCVAGMVALILIVGGLTRLTDSGLSITEWKPVTGVVPPLSHDHWLEEFEKYKQIPEYQQINKGMSLSEFQWIYWWEWAHRFLARTVGLVFAIPFLFFAIKGRIGRSDWPKYAGLFLLGGFQGFMGWYMVSSGLSERVDVSQYRLAAHLGIAVLIFGFSLWLALGHLIERRAPGPAALAVAARLTIGLIFLQILSGAFVAGTDAGFTYNTWPLMDGAFIPDQIFDTDPAWLAAFEDHRTIQFNHRMLGYGVAFMVFALWFAGRGRHVVLPYGVRPLLTLLLGLVLVQIALGVWTLLAVVPIAMGALHQFGALCVFGAAIVLAYRLNPR